MELYLFIFAFSIFLLFIKNKKFVLVGCNTLLCLMALMCIFRSEDVGVDTQNYLLLFTESGIEQFLTKDPIYGVICLLVYNYSGDYTLVQIVIGILTYVPLIYILNKKSENLALSVFLVLFSTNRYFFESFNAARQCASTSFLLLCWFCLQDKKKFLSLIWFLIAFGLHHSALYYIPIVLVAYYHRFSNFVVICSSIATFLFSIVFSDMSILVDLQKHLFSDEFIGKYDTYREDLARTIWGLLPVILPYTVVTCLFYKKYCNSTVFRIFAYGTIFANFISVLPLAYRISYGVIALEIFIYPLLLKEKKNNIVVIGILFCLFVFSFLDFLSSCKEAKLVPYTTFLGW